jgi:hypothetical protein
VGDIEHALRLHKGRFHASATCAKKRFEYRDLGHEDQMATEFWQRHYCQKAATVLPFDCHSSANHSATQASAPSDRLKSVDQAREKSFLLFEF